MAREYGEQLARLREDDPKGYEQLVKIHDRMMDLDREVKVTRAGKELFAGTVPRTVRVMLRTLAGRGDPRLMFDAEIAVELSAGK